MRSRKRRQTMRRLVAGVLLVVTLVLLVRAGLYHAYPLRYWDVVSNRALDHGLDPLLIAAVIRVESGWNAAATSEPGARGLMQVMPATGQEVAERLQISGFQPELLYNPEINIRIGTFYFALLQREFGGNRTAALAAYNGGMGHVEAWLRQGTWTGSEQELQQIPFAETREFVQRVLRDYDRYRKLYHPDGQRRW